MQRCIQCAEGETGHSPHYTPTRVGYVPFKFMCDASGYAEKVRLGQKVGKENFVIEESQRCPKQLHHHKKGAPCYSLCLREISLISS